MIRLSTQEWQAFADQSMQDTTAAASLLKFSSTEAVLLSQNNLNNPEKQHAAGLINGFFGHEAQTVYQNNMAALQDALSSLDGNTSMNM